jgi:hypothetical protein
MSANVFRVVVAVLLVAVVVVAVGTVITYATRTQRTVCTIPGEGGGVYVFSGKEESSTFGPGVICTVETTYWWQTPKALNPEG